MPPSTVRPPFDQFLATANAVARERPEVDREMAREVFQEAATLLDNGLALEGLDEHDASAVVAGLCVDLVAEDPGAAIRARSKATLETPCDMHDPRSCVRCLSNRCGDLSALSTRFGESRGLPRSARGSRLRVCRGVRQRAHGFVRSNRSRRPAVLSERVATVVP